jgi:hypothetical protein
VCAKILSGQREPSNSSIVKQSRCRARPRLHTVSLAAALLAAANGLHDPVGELDVPSDSNGSGVEPATTGLDVCNVARAGSGPWSTERDPWRLTHADLRAIGQSWSGDPDDLSPSITAAIAITLNARKPWREPVDDIHQPLRWADGISTTRPSASRVYDALLGGGHPGKPVPGLPVWHICPRPRSAQTPAWVLPRIGPMRSPHSGGAARLNVGAQSVRRVGLGRWPR